MPQYQMLHNCTQNYHQQLMVEPILSARADAVKESFRLYFGLTYRVLCTDYVIGQLVDDSESSEG